MYSMLRRNPSGRTRMYFNHHLGCKYFTCSFQIYFLKNAFHCYRSAILTVFSEETPANNKT